MNSKPVISVEEARKILGGVAENMTDEEIESVVETLDLLAIEALKYSNEELLRKRDAKQLAELTYDIYKEQKTRQNDKP